MSKIQVFLNCCMAKGFWKLESMPVVFYLFIFFFVHQSTDLLPLEPWLEAAAAYLTNSAFLILTIKSFKQKNFQDYIFLMNCYGSYQKYLPTNISLCMPACFAYSSVVHMFMCACVWVSLEEKSFHWHYAGPICHIIF